MTPRTLFTLVLAATLTGAVSCTRDATAPTLARADLPDADWRWRHSDNFPNGGRAAPVRCDLHPAATGSADIGAQGGRITAGPVTLSIPPGALSHTVHITATVPAGSSVFVEFQPSGLLFRRPAGLYLSTESCEVPPNPEVLYVDDDGRVLERIQTRYLPYLQIVAAPIRHFSGYVLAW